MKKSNLFLAIFTLGFVMMITFLSCETSKSDSDPVPVPNPNCGNGTLDTGETCDDGNTASGDGCSAFCQVEGSASLCGNGNIDPGETCDDKNTASGDGCSSVCLLEGGGPVCGNFILETGEACDDGNTASGDGCSSICQYENCGNGVAEGDEYCDGIDFWGTTCFDLGFSGGSLSCAADCFADLSGCTGSPIPGWTCVPGYYNAGDGCDCGCGIVDPDCADATAASCDFCGDPGACNQRDFSCLNIQTFNNAACN